MNIGLVSHYTPNFQSMAALTVPGKQKYSERYGYPLFIKTDNFRDRPGCHLSHEKCGYLNEIMEAHPEIDWFWYSGCDCMITNLTFDLKELIDNDYHFIVCKDDHGINGDVFFIRNSPEGREYMQHLDMPSVHGTEQGHMWEDEANPKWSAITKYLPQVTMNAYDLTYYPHKSGTDILGGRSNWQPGDFVLQAVTGYMPGMTAEEVYNWKLGILNSHITEIIS